MRTMTHQCVVGRDIRAVIFGVDGVLVDTFHASATAWKTVLDPLLRSCAAMRETNCRLFDAITDYTLHMQSRTCMDGLRRFLRACEIQLTYDDLRGLTARHDELFLTIVRENGVQAFASTVTVLHVLRRQGIGTAAVSATRYAAELLRDAGVAGLFDIRLDGQDAAVSGPPGPPGVGLYREASRRMRTSPPRTAVVETNVAALRAARRAGLGLIVGVERGGASFDPAEYGADTVVADLSDLRLGEPVG